MFLHRFWGQLSFVKSMEPLQEVIGSYKGPIYYSTLIEPLCEPDTQDEEVVVVLYAGGRGLGFLCAVSAFGRRCYAHQD